MTDVPLSQLPPEEKAERGGSFGNVASNYENFRPGPPSAAIDWILEGLGQDIAVVDLGAGTGACTRLLVPRANQVTAVEPDERMRTVLSSEVTGAHAVEGQGESIPLPDASADAVVASSSWHWMDLIPTLLEVGRVLRPGGTLGVVWSGPDPDGPFLAQARALLSGQGTTDTASDTDVPGPTPGLASLVMGDADRPASVLEIPDDGSVPFDQPEHETFLWDMALTGEDLIGLLGTFSWIILMPEETRTRVVAEARRILTEVLGLVGDATVDVAYRAEAWRARRHLST